MLSNELMAFIGFILGPLVRTLYDYVFKLLEDPDLAFDKKYWVTMAASMVVGLVLGLVQSVTILSNIPQGSVMLVFFMSFAQGFALNHVVNKPVGTL